MAQDDGDVRDAMALLGAMALGAVVGAATALLLAPKSGHELRSELGDAATRAKQRAEELRAQMGTKYEELRARVDEHISKHHEEDIEGAEEGRQIEVEDADEAVEEA